MSIPDRIKLLVERFHSNIESYKRGIYNETQVRHEFIDPFFQELGWDINNTKGYAEAYKDVIHEDSIKVGGITKAPDYCFRIGGVRKFFLEAKKPAINIKDDVNPAYQLRRYGWSAKLPLSILTDFEEFAVYDCRTKPSKTDKASHSRIIYMQYTDYEKRWDEIKNIFSREAILKGSFDKYAQSSKGKKGTSEVDASFLQEIERWRDALARNIALRNPHLNQRELNFAVQQTIDRIVFLRICEDRAIEPYGSLMELQKAIKEQTIYERLFEIFKDADDKYNSGLFHFKPEKEHKDFDKLTPNLRIDDSVLKDIFKNLYYPDSPYEFSVLPADILGQIYEKFLGKVIRLTPKHQAVIEEKPEVRKAGGVYYTPTYIVDYIVKNTIGKLLKDKKPANIQAIKILDPSCGSGSFLIGAYQFLLDWHLEQYINDNPERWAKGKKPALYQSDKGEWRLTTDERKRILLNNIYGVDIDSQAVEVTKLSLLLKVLEGESEQIVKLIASFKQYKTSWSNKRGTQKIRKDAVMFKERILPALENNIKCGNSLIGTDFYDNENTLFNEDEIYRINAFDWNIEFSAIMQNGGFDAIIGNPPYVRIQAMKEWSPLEVGFYRKQYFAASKGNYDIYVVFVEQGLNLLNPKGVIGFILPHKFFNSNYGEPLRRLLSEGKHLSQIVHFGDQQVFSGATTYTCLLFLNKSDNEQLKFIKIDDLKEWNKVEGVIPLSKLTKTEWNFVIGKGASLFERLNEMPVKLGDIAYLYVGLQTDADDVYIVEEIRQDNERVLCESKATGKQHWFENYHLKAFLKGSINIRRYSFTATITKRLIFPYETINNKSVLISKEKYLQSLPLTWAYLQENSARLRLRNKAAMGENWYGYVYKKNHTRFEQSKLLVPSIAIGSTFSIDLYGRFYFAGSGGGGGGGYGITLHSDIAFSQMYLLGILNSSLLSFYLKKISTPFRGGYIALNRQYIEKLPIRTIDFTNPTDKAEHDLMVSLVERMLDLHKMLNESNLQQEKIVITRQIEGTDRQIDQLVYNLYGLTEDEIAVVEKLD
ncbi:MAG: Eco57I restriction-modification methylase domain-containing protein [Desulfamplus sp.]|nr:Eco57I restriction-modification methylase domain-containing protein [Desulfamplus sp.]